MAQHGALPGASGSGARRARSNIVSQADSPRTRVKMNVRTHGTGQDTPFPDATSRRNAFATNQSFGVCSAPAAKLAAGTGSIVSTGTDLLYDTSVSAHLEGLRSA